MTPLRIPLLILGLVVLGGCASVRVSSEFDLVAPFDRYQRFDWYTPFDRSEDAVVPGFRRLGREAITELLNERGYDGPTPEADFLVRFYAFLELDRDIVVAGDGEIFDPMTIGHAEPPVEKNPDEVARPDDVFVPNPSADWGVGLDGLDKIEVGDVVVEIADAATRKLVWRGKGRGIVEPGMPKRELVQVLDKVLAKFPPALPAPH